MSVRLCSQRCGCSSETVASRAGRLPQHNQATREGWRCRRSCSRADPGPAKWFPTQEQIRTSSNDGKGAKTQARCRSYAGGRDAHIVRKEKQEQNHPDLDDAYTSLRSHDGLHPGRHLRRVGAKPRRLRPPAASPDPAHLKRTVPRSRRVWKKRKTSTKTSWITRNRR